MGLTLATGGWQGNLIVYLIQKFNVKRINAAQISNIMYGFTSLFPVIGAIVADSSLGSFVVASISACISLLVIISLSQKNLTACCMLASLCLPFGFLFIFFDNIVRLY